jgi:hypothetical protein
MSKWRLYKHHLGDYMRRWIFQTPWGTIHLHHILRSDGDRAFHDHPWNFTSILLSGGYTELRPTGHNATTMQVWPRWSIVRRKATSPNSQPEHRTPPPIPILFSTTTPTRTRKRTTVDNTVEQRPERTAQYRRSGNLR